MTPRSAELHAMALAHFNEPILCGGQVVRLIGYGEDMTDCYLIVKPERGEAYWNTCVGGYIWLDRLKGQNHVRSTAGEDWDDFVRLDDALERNGAPKASEFIVDLRPEEDWPEHTIAR